MIRATTTEGESTADLLGFGLGGNVGDSDAKLRWALERLEDELGPLETASFYRTVAISPIPQADYLNTVALAGLGECPPGPREILARVKALERRAGRRRGPRFGPRPLDIDLLFYGDLVLDAAETASATGAELILPHPRMRRRRFVLAPLAELRPHLRLPPDGARVCDLLAALDPDQVVERIHPQKIPEPTPT